MLDRFFLAHGITGVLSSFQRNLGAHHVVYLTCHCIRVHHLPRFQTSTLLEVNVHVTMIRVQMSHLARVAHVGVSYIYIHI